MARIAQVVFIALMLMSPAVAVAGPAEDANAAVDRWSAAYNSNDPETIAKNYCPDAILLGTVSPVMSEGTEAIIPILRPQKEPATKTRSTNDAQSQSTITPSKSPAFTRLPGW